MSARRWSDSALVVDARPADRFAGQPRAASRRPHAATCPAAATCLLPKSSSTGAQSGPRRSRPNSPPAGSILGSRSSRPAAPASPPPSWRWRSKRPGAGRGPLRRLMGRMGIAGRLPGCDRGGLTRERPECNHGANFRQANPSKTKHIQPNPNKFAFLCLDLFGRIRDFSKGYIAEKQKKFRTGPIHAAGCAQASLPSADGALPRRTIAPAGTSFCRYEYRRHGFCFLSSDAAWSWRDLARALPDRLRPWLRGRGQELRWGITNYGHPTPDPLSEDERQGMRRARGCGAVW